MRKNQIMSAEQKIKIANSLIGHVVSKSVRDKIKKSMTGKVRTDEFKKKISKTITGRIGELANSWKGDNVGYGGIHKWIRLTLGKAIKCDDENCSGKSTYYEWSNVSGNYLRNLTDWKQRCVSCHKIYDKNKKK